MAKDDLYGGLSEEELRKMSEEVADVEFQSDVEYAGGPVLEGNVDPKVYQYVGSSGEPTEWNLKGRYLDSSADSSETFDVPKEFKKEGKSYTMEPGEIVGIDSGASRETAAHEYTHKLHTDRQHKGYLGITEEGAVRGKMLREAKNFDSFANELFFEMNQEKHKDKMRTKKLDTSNKEDLELIIESVDSLLQDNGYGDGADKHVDRFRGLDPSGLEKRMSQQKDFEWEEWKKENPTWHKLYEFLSNDMQQVKRQKAGERTKNKLADSYRNRWKNFRNIAALKLSKLEENQE